MIAAVIAVAVGGCAASVRLVSAPPGASFEHLDQETGEVISRCLAPCETRLRYRPGRPDPWRARLPGREPLDFDLMRTEGRLLRWIGGGLFQRGGREITIVLLPTRTPVGTPDEGAR